MSRPTRGYILLTIAALAATGAIAVLGAWFASRGPEEPELPAEYRGLDNPLEGDAAAVEEGRLQYSKNCAVCHGQNADGHGPSAVGLNPAPADFRNGPILDSHSDAWLFWRISEGKHKTAMPRWNGVFDERTRWALVTYLRSLQK